MLLSKMCTSSWWFLKTAWSSTFQLEGRCPKLICWALSVDLGNIPRKISTNSLSYIFTHIEGLCKDICDNRLWLSYDRTFSAAQFTHNSRFLSQIFTHSWKYPKVCIFKITKERTRQEARWRLDNKFYLPETAITASLPAALRLVLITDWVNPIKEERASNADYNCIDKMTTGCIFYSLYRLDRTWSRTLTPFRTSNLQLMKSPHQANWILSYDMTYRYQPASKHVWLSYSSLLSVRPYPW